MRAHSAIYSATWEDRYTRFIVVRYSDVLATHGGFPDAHGYETKVWTI